MKLYYTDMTFRKGSSQKSYRRLVSWEIADLHQVFEYLRQRHPYEVHLSVPPVGPDSWRSKIRPYISFDDGAQETIDNFSGLKLPKSYVELVAEFGKRDFYREIAGERLDNDLDTEKYGKRATVADYFRLKIRSHVIQMYEDGDILDSDDLEDLEAEGKDRVAREIKFINGAIEKIDLGRRSHLKTGEPNPFPNLGRPLGEAKRIIASISSPTVREYLSAGERNRKAMLNRGGVGSNLAYLTSLFEKEGLRVPEPDFSESLESLRVKRV